MELKQLTQTNAYLIQISNKKFDRENVNKYSLEQNKMVELNINNKDEEYWIVFKPNKLKEGAIKVEVKYTKVDTSDPIQNVINTTDS